MTITHLGSKTQVKLHEMTASYSFSINKPCYLLVMGYILFILLFLGMIGSKRYYRKQRERILRIPSR
jgi:hypothetical protein